MGEAATDGAPVADDRVGDQSEGEREQWAARADDLVGLRVSLAYGRADGNAAAVAATRNTTPLRLSSAIATLSSTIPGS